MDTSAEPLLALPTHRVARGRERRRRARRGGVVVGPLRGRAGRPRGAPRGVRPGGAGARRPRADRALDARRRRGADGSARGVRAAPAVRGRGRCARLDVTLLAAALERLCGIDRAATTTGGRVGYTKDVGEAIAWVDGRVDAADAAFLLEATPVAEIAAVARDGDVMPQK